MIVCVCVYEIAIFCESFSLQKKSTRRTHARNFFYDVKAIKSTTKLDENRLVKFLWKMYTERYMYAIYSVSIAFLRAALKLNTTKKKRSQSMSHKPWAKNFISFTYPILLREYSSHLSGTQSSQLASHPLASIRLRVLRWLKMKFSFSKYMYLNPFGVFIKKVQETHKTERKTQAHSTVWVSELTVPQKVEFECWFGCRVHRVITWK